VALGADVTCVDRVLIWPICILRELPETILKAVMLGNECRRFPRP
jgi:hypothetical protein